MTTTYSHFTTTECLLVFELTLKRINSNIIVIFRVNILLCFTSKITYLYLIIIVYTCNVNLFSRIDVCLTRLLLNHSSFSLEETEFFQYILDFVQNSRDDFFALFMRNNSWQIISDSKRRRRKTPDILVIVCVQSIYLITTDYKINWILQKLTWKSILLETEQ